MNDCIFCKIINNEMPSFKVHETATHLAFLDINPNTKGVTLVIPKIHVESTVINMDENIYITTLQEAKLVAENLAQKLNVEKVGMAIEGTGVNHFHVKLYPFYTKDLNQLSTEPTTEPSTKTTTVKQGIFNEVYPGYLTTQIGPQADFAELEELAKKLAF